MSQNISKKSRFFSFWWMGLGVILLLITALYYSNIVFGIENFSNYISLPLYMIIPGALVLLGIGALIRSNKISELSQTSLIFLVISFSCSLAAEQTWNLYEHVLDIDPYPSIADFFYLSAPIAMFISLIFFLKPIRNQIPKKNILFAATLSALVLIPTIIATYDVGIDDTPFEIIVALLYPIVDSVLLTAAIIAILFSVWNKRNFFWIMILIGILILITADTVFLFLIIDDAYTDGHPVDVLWISAYTIWAFMMYYIINNSNQNLTAKNEHKKYKIEKLDKFGIIVALILINITIGIILISLNYFADNNSSENIIPYFSWFLITIVIIFSSIILFLNSKLNKTLLSRTIKLEELSQELIKSERFSAIGELSGRLAHDLRNPLSVIKMAVDLLVQQPKDKKISDPDVLRRIELINKSISRISHQVDDVLGYARNSPLKLSNLSVQKLLKNSIEKINVPENVEISISDKDANMNCDPVKIDAVFINLIVNAIQAMPNNGGKISINIIENTDDIKIEFSDIGDGIPDPIIDKIFEPLFTTKQKGTGLGLAICKQIVEQHMGKISAKNNPTIFTVEIPKHPNTD